MGFRATQEIKEPFWGKQGHLRYPYFPQNGSFILLQYSQTTQAISKKEYSDFLKAGAA